MRSSVFVPLCIAAMLLAGGMTPANAADDAVKFNRDIRPILSDNCFACHGPDRENLAAGLRLDRRETAVADRAGSAAIVPRDPQRSELFHRITMDDRRQAMPPEHAGERLSEQQIGRIRRWIEQGAEYEDHWAFVPPQRAETPPVRSAAWPINWIDHFVLARLEQDGFEPSPAADRVTLIRRLSFDLRGLPPTTDEVDAFVHDDRPDAYERLVEQFLGSPHYGERMTVYWLDLVRYADSVGYHGDQEHNATPYRDWVIDAFNANMPFDQFTIEQLAGDLLDDPTTDQKIASAYNRLLQTSHEGGVQDGEYHAKQDADRVRNVSSVWMGVTLGCAECHDHKFDPFTIEEFYSFAAFFADIQEYGAWTRLGGNLNSSPTRRPPEMDVQINGSPRRVMITAARDEPRVIRVLPRGDWLDGSGAVVQPVIPEVLGKLPVEGRATRLDLARWLVDRENPLTARVTVNRFWYLLFGSGISRVLDDLGYQGEWPVHPELLDALAVEFMDSGWDVKHMMRLIVTSQAYRQSALVPDPLREADPDNRRIARQSRWRLPAEFIRDTGLAVSGLLVDRIGGPSSRPYQPARYYSQLNFPTREYQPSSGSDLYRRGVYMHWQRTYLHPALIAFDAPSREECVAERPVSNTPLAALTLLNDPTFVEFARVFAQNLLSDQAELADRDRLIAAFRRVLSRPPQQREIDLLQRLLAEERREYATDADAARKLVAVGEYPAPDAIDVAELAAWTAVTRTLLNLDETIMRH